MEQKQKNKIECVMCGERPEFIATETKELLCRNFTIINEDIKHRDYPHKINKFRPIPVIEEEK